MPETEEEKDKRMAAAGLPYKVFDDTGKALGYTNIKPDFLQALPSTGGKEKVVDR